MTEQAPVEAVGKSNRIDAYLIIGGKYHDFDHPRLELLKLLSEQERIKVRIGEDYSDIDVICDCDFIISYTVDVMPSAEETEQLCEAVRAGKKWFALHGTNSILGFLEDGRVNSPRDNEPFMEMMGSQFLSHPPIIPYDVEVTEPDHPLVKGIGNFTVNDDELYLSVMHGEHKVLMKTHWTGTTEAFVDAEWEQDEPRPIMYLHPYGNGEVLYLTLGHSRGKYDMQPMVEEYPEPERGAWQNEEFYELLRRGIRWAMGTL